VIEISQHFNLAFYFSGCILQGKVVTLSMWTVLHYCL